MKAKLIAAALTVLAIAASPPAQAEKGGGGMSASHMSAHGMQNANSPAVGQEKGTLRADERKSAEGLLHDHPSKNTAKGQKKGLHK
jgi:hypothetical protein